MNPSNLQTPQPRNAAGSGHRVASPLGMEEKFEKMLKIEEETSHKLPEEEITQEQLDALYARDMYALTLKERDQVYLDVHGVADAIEETPDFVEEHRSQLLHALDSLIGDPRKTTTAFEQALEQNSAYVKSEKMHVTFLRADRWDPKRAASRMVQFFKAKLKLFGPLCLTHAIRITDLSKEDKKSLESGFFQLLPVRDVGGRAIMSGMPMLRQYKDLENLTRAFFYMAMTALEDSETQKSGIVMVGYNMGEMRLVDRPAVWAIQRLRKVLPMRVVGMHYCYDDFKMRPMMSLAMLVMGATGRVRFRPHYGNPKENLFKLLTFGIPDQALPITAEGEPKVKYHRQWLKSRRCQEETQSSSEIIVVPGRLDTLLGRGKPIQEHFGNLRYHALLDYYQPAYERAKKFDKMQIAQRIVHTVHEYSGQFLKQEGAGWVVVDDVVARDKVSHAFRTRRATTCTAAATPRSTTTATKRRTWKDPQRVVPNSVASTEVTTVTDEEHDRDDSSSVDGDLDAVGGKRSRLWASSFHEVGTI